MLKGIFHILLFLLLLFTLSYGQQFNLLWSKQTSGNTYILYIGDVDNDGKGEFYIVGNSYVVHDTNYIADYTLNTIKYDLKNLNIELRLPYKDDYGYYDFNNDGIVDYYFSTNDSFGIYDLANNKILFELKEKAYYDESSIDIEAIDDINGDGKIEFLLNETKSGTAPHYDFYYLYSTEVSITSLVNSELTIPNNFSLKQNYPNPFNPTTTIEYEIPSPGSVNITIYDIKGSIIKVVKDYHNFAGNYRYVWDGKNNFGEIVSSGPYFYQLQYKDNLQTKKMIYLK